MITKSDTGHQLLPASNPFRDIAKLNMILELVLKAAAQRGVLRIGPWDFTNTALQMVRTEVLANREFWLAIYRQVELVIKQP